MAYGASADEELVRQFQKVCRFCGNQDHTQMTRIASKTLVKLFWRTDPNFSKYNLKACERAVFAKLTNKKADTIRVDGPHVEAYLMEMAHEVTKVTREDPKILRNHPYVTFCKGKLEGIVRGTIIQGYHIDLMNGTGQQKDEAAEAEAAKIKPYPYKKPEPPKNMKKHFDLRKRMPIVLAKRDYGNFT